MPTNTPLFGAGSTNAAGVALYHYTTRIDEVKEGNESPGHNVDIGVHYVAATNLPSSSAYEAIDTDGDGIPDYVEDANGNGISDPGETSWTNQFTDAGVWDPTNSIYMDTDLSGDGLVNRIKMPLGIGPFETANPLALTKIITGREPDVSTFFVPISYNVLTNIGTINLNLGGFNVEFLGVYPTNAGSLIAWNTDFSPPGQGYLQAQLTLNGNGDDGAILNSFGTILPYVSTNVIQFYSAGSFFTTGEDELYAQLTQQSADYNIQLFDPCTRTLLRTINGSTSDGTILESWGVTNSGGSAFNGNAVDAVFTVTVPVSGSGEQSFQAKLPQSRIPSNEQDGGFDFAYFFEPTNNPAMEPIFDYGGDVWKALLNPVAALLAPQTVGLGGQSNAKIPSYSSGFDYYQSEGQDHWGYGTEVGYPGYLKSEVYVTNDIGIQHGLLPDIGSGSIKNVFCAGHGNATSIGTFDGSVEFHSWQIAALLGNQWSDGRPHLTNAFRFVFLDGCNTASKQWRQAFGIIPNNSPSQAFYPLLEGQLQGQAYVGWAGESSSWFGCVATNDPTMNDTCACAYAQTLQDFFYNWMRDVPLATCLYDAEFPKDSSAPLTTLYYKNKTVTISATTSYGYQTYVDVPISNAAPLSVVGHPGISRTQWQPFLDKSVFGSGQGN